MSRELQIITLDGDGYARGQQYGEQVRPLIHEAIERMEEQLASGGGMFSDRTGAASGLRVDARRGSDQAQEVLRFLAATQFRQDIKAWVPDLLDETTGIAEGANVAVERVLALQLLDEIWAYETARASNPEQSPRACTSMAVVASQNQPALLAQNLDVASWMDGLQLVLRIRDPLNEVHAIVYTIAGMIGANGVNSRSLGVGVNGLPQLRNATRGLPVAFVVRALLAQPSLRAAQRYIKAIPHATGQHYLLASPEGIVGFECSANSVETIESKTRLAHSNHPLFHADRHHGGREDELARADTGARLDFVERCLADGTEWSATRLQRVLADTTVPVCRIPDGRVDDFTFASTIMELGQQPRMMATAGPPTREPFVGIEFD